MVAWILSAWDWLWQQCPIVIVIGLFLSGFVALCAVLVLAGLLFGSRSGSILLAEAIEHIAKRTLGGAWNLRKASSQTGATILGVGYAWEQLKDHGTRGLITLKGYAAKSAAPQTITPDDWKSELIGYDIDRDGRPVGISAGGRGQKWSRVFISEAELYRFWPKSYLAILYWKVRKWRAANT